MKAVESEPEIAQGMITKCPKCKNEFLAVERPQPPPETSEADKPEFDPTDTTFWRRKAMQHASDLEIPEDELRQLCCDHFFQYDFEAGAYLRDQNGDKIPVAEKKQLHWSQWKQLAGHLYSRWVDAGKPEKSKSEPEKLTEKTKLAIQTALINFPDVSKYMTIKSTKFRLFANNIIGHKYRGYTGFNEAEGQMILDALAKEKAEIEAHEAAEGFIDPEDEYDPETEPVDGMSPEAQDKEAEAQETFNQEQEGDSGPPMKETQFKQISLLINDMPKRFNGSTGSIAFRDFVRDITKRRYEGIRMLTEAEANDVILTMKDIIDEESNNAAFYEMNVGE
jgi:hypothetical protein